MSKYLIVLALLLFNFVLNEPCVGTDTTNLNDETCGGREHPTGEKCVVNEAKTNCELEKIACKDADAGQNNNVNETFCGLFDYNKDKQKCLPKDDTHCDVIFICGQDTPQSNTVDKDYCNKLYYDKVTEECVVDTSKESKQCKIQKIVCEDADAGNSNKVNDTFCEKFYYDETKVKCISNDKNTECITKYLCTSGTPDEDNDCGSFITSSNEKKCVKTSDGKKCEEVNKEDEKSSSEMNKLRFFLLILILNLIY